MSLNDPLQSCGISELPSELESLFSNLSMGIHAASQPLTVLRAGLWPDSVVNMTQEELREFIGHSASAVERVCAAFNLTRELLNSQRIRACYASSDLVPIMREVAREFELNFGPRGVSLDTDSLDAPLWAVADGLNIRKALENVLAVAGSLSIPGDNLEMLAWAADGEIKLTVSNAEPRCSALNAEQTLALAVADTVLSKQNCMTMFTMKPFCFQIRFKGIDQISGGDDR
jgi:hypothetical protein